MWRKYMEVARSELWALATQEKRTWRGREPKRGGDGGHTLSPIFSCVAQRKRGRLLRRLHLYNSYLRVKDKSRDVLFRHSWQLIWEHVLQSYQPKKCLFWRLSVERIAHHMEFNHASSFFAASSLISGAVSSRVQSTLKQLKQQFRLNRAFIPWDKAVYMRKLKTLALDPRTRTTTRMRFNLMFFSRILKNKQPRKHHCTFFAPEKLARLFLLKDVTF